MRVQIRRSLPVVILGFGAVNAAPAATPACGPVVEAFRHSYAVPYHQSIHQREDGKTTQSELLFDGRSLYMKIDGSWFDAGSMDNPFKDLVASALQATACTKLREEAVGNQPATVYEITEIVEGKAGQSQVWVSATGFVLRMRDATHDDFDLTADYVGIKAPAGAKRIGS